jgi:hypothetical protein
MHGGGALVVRVGNLPPGVHVSSLSSTTSQKDINKIVETKQKKLLRTGSSTNKPTEFARILVGARIASLRGLWCLAGSN